MKSPEHPLLRIALAKRAEGVGPSQTARDLRVTRQVIIGVLYRHDHPERIRSYDRSRQRPPRARHKPYRCTVQYAPSKYPYAPDCSCPDFAWDDDHCAAVLSLGGYPILPLRRAA